MLQYRIANLYAVKLKIATDPKARSTRRNGTKVASLNAELQFRCLIAAASTTSRTLDSLSRSSWIQKRNPGRGNAGASQIGDLSGEGHRQPY